MIRRALHQKLTSLEASGVEQIRRPQSNTDKIDLASNPVSDGDSETNMANQDSQPQSLFGDKIAMRAPLSREKSKGRLQVLQQEVVGCTRCAELVQNRTQTVFGVGDPQARLVFFGEAPGADEDRQGEPFIGRAGKLLTDIISKGMGMSRDEVYIMNVLKCRPPGNRNPIPSEAENCCRFFEQQFEIIRPDFICCLGAIAATTLLQTNQSIGQLRGRLHDYRGIRVLATYHPAYLLRNPSAKKEVWKDIQLLMAEMELPIPIKK